MTPPDSPSHLLTERALRFTWHGDLALEDAVSLLRDYLKRAALWAEALHRPDAWPIFDIAALVAPELRAADEDVERLSRSLAHQTGPVLRSLIAAVHWQEVKSSPQRAVYRLPDPFEPLVALYEKGGGFRPESGQLYDLGGVAVSVRSYADWLKRGHEAYPQASPRAPARESLG
jgi:hypothetical protein